MSPFQVAKQVKQLLLDALWPDSPYESVLGSSVYVTAGVRADDDLPAQLPFALVNLGQQTADHHDPSLLTQEIIVVLAAQVWGDPLGEHSLTGGPGADTSRYGRSDGRGLLELETVLLAAVGRLTGADGCPVLVSHGSAPAPERLDDDTHLVHRQYVLSVVCTRADEWPAPSEIAVNVSTPGQATVSWVLAPDRYGRRKTVVRYASGSTAPTSEGGGTGATIAAETTTSVVITLAAGTWSFAIFTAYTESGADENEKHSSQVTGTTKTAVVT